MKAEEILPNSFAFLGDVSVWSFVSGLFLVPYIHCLPVTVRRLDNRLPSETATFNWNHLFEKSNDRLMIIRAERSSL